MARSYASYQDAFLTMTYAGTAVPTPKHRQPFLYPDISKDIPAAHRVRVQYVIVGAQEGAMLNALQVMKNTASTKEAIALPVLKRIVDALEELHILEAIYGYADGNACKIVAIGDNLASAQRDMIWKVNLDFQRKHPGIDIDIRIIQRRGQDISDIFEDDGTAIVVREAVGA